MTTTSATAGSTSEDLDPYPGNDAPNTSTPSTVKSRHTFAVLQLSAGTHFMQVSKWLGHSTFTLTLDTYGDYIPEQDGGALNTLPEPPAPAQRAEAATNVVPLFGRQFS
jgi:integrase